jgi:hypothetical protein
MTTLGVAPFCNNHAPKAAVHSTMSCGVRLVPAAPPMVPLIPEMDFINAKLIVFCFAAKISNK